MATIQVNGSISMTANGNSTAYGNLTWTSPSLPADAVVSDISVSGTYNWSGRGNVTVYINGESLYSGSDFDVSLGASATSPYQISCRGGNKNATGSNFSWGTLRVTYTYTVPSAGNTIYIKQNGAWVEGTPLVKVSGTWKEVSKVFKKVNGTWVEQSDKSAMFDPNAIYIGG